MKCDNGCGDCCGVVPVTVQEYDRVVAYANLHGIVPLTQGVTCPFFQEGTCKVYPVRPRMCQMFGHTAKLKCSRGYNTNVLSDREVQREMKRNGKPNRMLHGVLGREAQADMLRDVHEILG